MTSHVLTLRQHVFYMYVFEKPVGIPFISRQYSGSSFVLIDFVIGSQNQIWLSFSPSSFSGHVITSVSGSATFPATSKTRPLRRLCILKYLPSGMTAFVGYSSLLLYEQIPRNMKYSCECNPFEWFDALKCLVVAKLNQCRFFFAWIVCETTFGVIQVHELTVWRKKQLCWVKKTIPHGLQTTFTLYFRGLQPATATTHTHICKSEVTVLQKPNVVTALCHTWLCVHASIKLT